VLNDDQCAMHNPSPIHNVGGERHSSIAF